jgi:hypothetical protein
MRILAFILAFALSLTLPVLASDWTVERVRGDAQQLVGDTWEPLSRGDVVPDDRTIRTLVGRMTLVRGSEVIELGSGTRIEIVDKEGRRPFTTVRQFSGRVQVEADVRQVQHFAVHTPYLVAVVKGTRFEVTTSPKGSDVSVDRGAVAVTNAGSGVNTVLSAGQSAATAGKALLVQGRGDLPNVLDADGNIVTAPDGNGVGGVASGAVGAATGAASGAVGAVSGTAQGAASGAGAAVSGAVEGAGGVVSGAVGAVGGVVGGLL